MTLKTLHGPKAKKSLGQNFLQDGNISQRIVDALQISSADHVLEIGPGPGALTLRIHAAGPEWFTILEKDYYWAGAHKQQQPDQAPAVNVVLTDALCFPWHKLTAGRSWKVIGNLPYNVASPLMWDILNQATGLERAVFMIQKEVGDRIVAKPGCKQYGALSVWLQSHSVPHRELIVPPHVFKPRPKVDSAVLSFEPIPVAERTFDAQALSWLLKVCFQQRRKQLQKILRSYIGDATSEVLNKVGIEPSVRPEALDPEQFQQLGNTIKSYIPS